VLNHALAQVPVEQHARALVRGDSGAGTHAFLEHLHRLDLQYSVGIGGWPTVLEATRVDHRGVRQQRVALSTDHPRAGPAEPAAPQAQRNAPTRGSRLEVHADALLTLRNRLALAQCVLDDRWPLRRAAERF
jgi:hypothetical protein